MELWAQAFYVNCIASFSISGARHKLHLKVTALVMEVYGYYNYVGCVVCYKYVLCLCCASGLINLQPHMAFVEWFGTHHLSRHSSAVTRYKRSSASHVTFYLHFYILLLFLYLNCIVFLIICPSVVIKCSGGFKLFDEISLCVHTVSTLLKFHFQFFHWCVLLVIMHFFIQLQQIP